MPRELQLVQLLERRTWRQQTGGGAGHHAVTVVFNPHAAASTVLMCLARVPMARWWVDRVALTRSPRHPALRKGLYT